MPSVPSYTSPYAPDHLGTAYQIADLMGRQGRSAAQAQGARALSVANLVGGIGGGVADVLASREAAQRNAAEHAAVAELIASGKPVDAMEVYRRFGPARTKELIPLIEAAQKQRDEAETKATKQRETAARQAFAQRIIDDPNSTPEQRHAATYWAGTGTAAPASLLPDPKAIAEAAEKAAAARTVENARGMGRMIDDARTAGATPEQIEALGRKYVVETGKEPSELLVPKPKEPDKPANPTEASLALLAAQGDAAAAKALTLLRTQRANGGGGSGTPDKAKLQALMKNIDANPALWDSLTPSLKSDLAMEGYAGQGKPLSNAAITSISNSKSAIGALNDLREVLRDNEEFIGPLAGYQAMNPYSAGRQAQADIDRVRQRVGKALEGGVLRKEDEEKYKLILATLHDTPANAFHKVDQLIEDIQRDIDIYIEEQRAQGRRVGTAAEVPTHRTPPLAPVPSHAPPGAAVARPGAGAGRVLGTGPFSVTSGETTYRFQSKTQLDEFKRKGGLP